MLVAFFVATVSVGVGKFRVAGLLGVSVVTDGQVCSCSEGRSEVRRVEDCAFLIDEVHLLFEG